MKKWIILLLVLVLAFSQALTAQDNAPVPQKTTGSFRDAITKTYFLKHIYPREVEQALKQYFWTASTLGSKKMITIKIDPSQLATFEQLLKKMDVPARTISFRIFTILASTKENGGKIENRDLRNVLSELKNLLNFKSFSLDGLSLLSVKEGSRGSMLSLSSSILGGLDLILSGVVLSETGSSGSRIEIEELTLSADSRKKTLISTSTSLRENGYLVAGVSKIGANGDSLILVINANIK